MHVVYSMLHSTTAITGLSVLISCVVKEGLACYIVQVCRWWGYCWSKYTPHAAVVYSGDLDNLLEIL